MKPDPLLSSSTHVFLRPLAYIRTTFFFFFFFLSVPVFCLFLVPSLLVYVNPCHFYRCKHTASVEKVWPHHSESHTYFYSFGGKMIFSQLAERKNYRGGQISSPLVESWSENPIYRSLSQWHMKYLTPPFWHPIGIQLRLKAGWHIIHRL